MSAQRYPLEEYFYPGNASCPGCGATMALRWVLKALGKKSIMVVPACCTSVFMGLYPKSAIGIPVLNIAFAAAAAAASGIVAALKARGKDATVLVWAGDGGTVDIGIQALSGAAERQTDFIYICYDNEAYMNTGIQRSGATPYGAITTTTPILGKREHKKNMPRIMIAHDIPYVATATSGYPHDLFRKVKKAKEKRGATRYIHILAPCPPGWRFDSKLTVKISRLAVRTGMWVLYEVEDGKFRLTGPSKALLDPEKRLPVEEYLKLQGRFSHLTREDIEEIQRWVDRQWELISKMVSKE
ncbi:MAG: pyruvate synthase subunit PorB [Candidatus Baldrarchaeia archaeon]